MTGADIFRIIISKFSLKKELGPIVLFVIDENLEINFYYTVFSLGLAISLNVKSSGELVLDRQELI